MTIEQETMRNPFGMDEGCTHCPELVEGRTSLVHGYGDVTADFVFVAERPTARADGAGHPVPTAPAGVALVDLLEAVGLAGGGADRPVVLENAFVTHLTRCRHPARAPTETEVSRCEPFLNAEVRSINPEILLPLGERALGVLVADYTTHDPAAVEVPGAYGSELRGRGFELLPLPDPGEMDDADFAAAVDALRSTMDRDYRQTKGRRGR